MERERERERGCVCVTERRLMFPEKSGSGLLIGMGYTKYEIGGLLT